MENNYDIVMIAVIKKIIQLLQRIPESQMTPGFKDRLEVALKELISLLRKFADLLLEDTNLINREELAFAEKIKAVVDYGIQNNHEMALAAVNHLSVYIKEKIALIEIAREIKTPSAP
jgi:hypothetical protein